MRVYYFFLIITIWLNFSCTAYTQTVWKHFRGESIVEEFVEIYSGAITLNNGNTVAAGFKITFDEDFNYDKFFKILTLLDPNGIVLKDTLIAAENYDAVFYIQKIPGSDQFYTLGGSVGIFNVVTDMWDENLQHISGIVSNLGQNIAQDEFVFRKTALNNGNVLFYAEVFKGGKDSGVVFEVDPHGNIVRNVVLEMTCNCLLQKKDGTGYYCFENNITLLNNDFSPVDIFEPPGWDSYYFGMEAIYYGDNIYVSVMDDSDNPEYFATVYKFDENMQVLKKHSINKFESLEGFVFNGFKVRENGEVWLAYSVYPSNQEEEEQLILAVMDTSLTSHTIFTLSEIVYSILGVSLEYDEYGSFYVCGLITGDDESSTSTFVFKQPVSTISMTKQTPDKLLTKIQPNPTSDVIRVEVLNPQDNLSYELIDVSGKSVGAGSILKSENIDIQMGLLQSGTYLLLIKNQQSVVFSQTVVKI